MRAAVLRQVGDTKLDVRDDVDVVPTDSGLVRVAIRATGICHTDLSAMDGTVAQTVPAVLGHEGAGTVIEVGDGVGNVAVGDHVVVAWVPPCGTCPACLGGQPNLCVAVMLTSAFDPRFRLGDEPVHAIVGTGTFAEEVVLPCQSVVKIPDDVPFDIASLLGCGVMTGVGAAINTAQVRPGSSVVVFGCGGVGVNVIQGARLAGAAEIVAVDLDEAKREQAHRFGATHSVSPDGLMEVSLEITGGDGFDYGFEVIGLSSTIRAAFDAVRRGGTCIVVGAGRADDEVSFNAFELFYLEKTLRGSLYGSADVRTDFHRLIRLWRAGRLDLEGLISQRVKLDAVNDALDDLRAGRVLRSVVEM